MNASKLDALLRRLESAERDPTWITRLTRERVEAHVDAAMRRPESAPLRGLTFGIKDNIDLAGIPTSAACPDFNYTPPVSAPVVDRLLEAGAVPIGKTNLDQFATGLVGVRSPYGVPRNPYHSDFIPGGSSSGSAVAVAAGWCDFALGTDTAGSGRVPAACNNLVGLKPTRGLLSTRGVVPACRSLDCVSIFTRNVADAARVFAVAANFDAHDPFSRRAIASQPASGGWPPRIGVPRSGQLEFFGNSDAAALFAKALDRWRALGANLVEIDFAPFREAAQLLYEGPWVAERYAAIRTFIEAKPDVLHPVTRRIIEGARKITAVDAFEARYKLAALRRRTESIWEEIDILCTPTAGTIYTIAEVESDPVRLNSNLGYYCNYVNLLDLCALAIPAGFLPNGVPWGLTLVAPAFCDDRVLHYGARFLGEAPPSSVLAQPGDTTRIAVCGAHLSGLSLNGELTRLGGRLVRASRTAPEYRLYALPDTVPPKPGLVRVGREGGGAPVEIEVWELSVAAFGEFVARIPAPLGIGTLRLEDGSQVQGFLCEPIAVRAARDVTSFGGWRNFLARSAG